MTGLRIYALKHLSPPQIISTGIYYIFFQVIFLIYYCKKAVLWIRIRMDPKLLPGSGSGSRIKVPDPDPAKSERVYK